MTPEGQLKRMEELRDRAGEDLLAKPSQEKASLYVLLMRQCRAMRNKIKENEK